jgi:NADH-quinone oxidoreductase subunit C
MLLDKIKKLFPDAECGSVNDILSITIAPQNVIKTLLKLKTDKQLRFTILTDLFGADFPNRNKRFEIVYNLLSLENNTRIIIKTHIDDGEAIATASNVFSSATWYEREVFDMFGITFTGNPDMRRILTDYGFVGHPLRKDFPVTGHVQVKYDETLQKVVYEPVSLDQDFREFDFMSPWQSPTYLLPNVLPGDEKATK